VTKRPTQKLAMNHSIGQNYQTWTVLCCERIFSARFLAPVAFCFRAGSGFSLLGLLLLFAGIYCIVRNLALTARFDGVLCPP